MARATAVVLLLVLVPLFVCAAESGMGFRHGKHHRRSARSASCKESCFRAGTDCFSLKAKAKSCFTCEQRPSPKLSWRETSQCPIAMCELVKQEFTEGPVSGDPAKLMPFCEGVNYGLKREQLAAKARVDDDLSDSGSPGGSGGSHDNQSDDVDDNTINVARDIDADTGAGIIVFPNGMCDFTGNMDLVEDDDTCNAALEKLTEDMTKIIGGLDKDMLAGLHMCLHGYTMFSEDDVFNAAPVELQVGEMDVMNDSQSDIGRLFYVYPADSDASLCVLNEDKSGQKKAVTGRELAHSRMCVFYMELQDLRFLIGGSSRVKLLPHYDSDFMRVVVEFSQGPCA